jgi:hypothetical protein
MMRGSYDLNEESVRINKWETNIHGSRSDTLHKRWILLAGRSEQRADCLE